MTEHDWLTGNDALVLLAHLFPMRGHDSTEPQPRASRLYLLGCARRAWDRLPGVCRAIVAVAEQVYFPREPDKQLRDAVRGLAEQLTHCRGDAACLNTISRAVVELGQTDTAAVWATADIDPGVWSGFAHLAYYPFARRIPDFAKIPPDLHSADLVREVFGNPFTRAGDFSPAWRNETVVSLAQHAHASGDFSMLPVLADALEEAGCDRADLLDHLRAPGTHIRGCWALELVLK